MGLSPMMQHYLQMKEKYKDCVVFYRLGDFYEMFFDDAVRVSKLLDLTLTGRDCGLEERAPMCGIPFHAADTYISRLVAMGEKVAICEQLSDPKECKGMVDRDVIRVVSAGTVIEDNLLDEKKNNYLACAYRSEKGYAVAWADITTGEFRAAEFPDSEKLLSFLVNLSVAEVICNNELLLEVKDCSEIERGALPRFSCYLPWAFQKGSAEKALFSQLSVRSAEALGLDRHPAALIAAGALVQYLLETQKHSLKNLNSVRYQDNSAFMTLDSVAVRNLELLKNNAEGKRYGSLLWLLDRTRTGMGARQLSSMILSPLHDKAGIERRLAAVDELYRATVIRMGLSDMLSGMRDVERLAGRISNGNLQPRDCLALSQSLSVVPSLKLQLAGFSCNLLREISADLVDTKPVCDLLDAAISPDAPATTKDGDYIREGYNSELDELRAVKNDSKKIIAEMEAREREATGIRTLKIGFNRVFGYYIEVSNSFKDKVPYSYVRRQTLTTGERYITEELKALESKIFGSEEGALRLESRLYAEILDVLERNIPVLQQISRAVAMLDVIVSFATVAKENRYCRPEIAEGGGTLTVEEGRHPVVEAISRERFIPNDCLLDGGENRTMIITGPNMAGKSTYLRQTALIVLMAHIGSFVPAKRAVVPLTDRIFTRIGASDNLILDRSTFMVEMTEVANILRNATPESLLILDEVGRGTSTYDGLSIAWSVIEYLTEKVRAKTLFATHYHELTELEGKLEGVKNYKINVRELNGTIVFLRKIVRGGASRSFGVEVAALAGVPEEVTSRAKRILKSLEKNDLTRAQASAAEEEEPQKEEKGQFLMKELKELDPDSLTPMQALMLLNEWKKKAEE